MSMLNDPAMKEIIDDFCEESFSLFNDMEDLLKELEDNPLETQKLEKFGQVIDRIMGAARSIGADEVGNFCELGKMIGYKSSQIKEVPLIEVVVAILFDATDLLKKMVEQIKTGNKGQLAGLNTKAFGTRLRWLSDKFNDIDRSSVSYELDQNSIDDLMNNLGL